MALLSNLYEAFFTVNDNGFVLKYEPIIKKALSETSAKSLISIYDNIKRSSNNSLELIEFFFSLEQNKLITDNQIKISFSKLLSEDGDLKLVFLFFYSFYFVLFLVRETE